MFKENLVYDLEYYIENTPESRLERPIQHHKNVIVDEIEGWSDMEKADSRKYLPILEELYTLIKKNKRYLKTHKDYDKLTDLEKLEQHIIFLEVERAEATKKYKTTKDKRWDMITPSEKHSGLNGMKKL